MPYFSLSFYPFFFQLWAFSRQQWQETKFFLSVQHQEKSAMGNGQPQTTTAVTTWTQGFLFLLRGEGRRQRPGLLDLIQGVASTALNSKGMQTQVCHGTSMGSWAQPWLETQRSLLICTKSAVSAHNICFSLKREGNSHGSVSGVCTARAPQHRGKKQPTMWPCLVVTFREFYGHFTLLEQPKQAGVQVHLPQLAGLMLSTEWKEFIWVTCYLPNTSWGFAVPHPQLCAFVTRNSISY